MQDATRGGTRNSEVQAQGPVVTAGKPARSAERLAKGDRRTSEASRRKPLQGRRGEEKRQEGDQVNSVDNRSEGQIESRQQGRHVIRPVGSFE